jgi:hypothetical protein
VADYPNALPSLTRVGNGTVGGADDPAADGSDTDAVVVVTALQDELEAIAAELGLTPSGSQATVAARFTTNETSISGLEDDVTTLTGRVDDVDSAIDGIDTTLAGLAADKADDAAVVHLTGDESVDGVKTFLDPPVSITPATTANELVSKAVMEAAISAAIAAAVDGAPGALDTLNELAAALGDDPSFAATVTSGLAAKADKAQNLSDLANIATARSNLGLGGAAVLSVGTTAGTVAAGDDARLSDTRTPTDNTVATAKVVDRAITFAKLQAIATARLLGRTTASSGDVEELTAAQATAMLDTFTSSLKGLAPASGGGTSNFLRADGSWAAPAGGGAFTAGTAAPSGGADGDWYLETDQGTLWQRVAGTWTRRARVAAGGIVQSDANAVDFTSDGGWTTTNTLGAFTFSGSQAQTQALFDVEVGSPTITANAVQVASATLAGAYATATFQGARETFMMATINTMPSASRNLYIGCGLAYPSYPWPYVRISNAGVVTLFDGGGTTLKTFAGTMDVSGSVTFKVIPGAVLVAARNSAGAILDSALFATNFASAAFLSTYGTQLLVGGDGKASFNSLEVFV